MLVHTTNSNDKLYVIYVLNKHMRYSSLINGTKQMTVSNVFNNKIIIKMPTPKPNINDRKQTLRNRSKVYLQRRAS